MAPATRRVLSHAQWSSLTASRLLLHQLLAVFLGDQPLVIGIDETASADRLERRWGAKIKAKGIYGTGHPAGCGSQQ